MTQTNKHLAIVHTSSITKKTEEEKQKFISLYEQNGFQVTELKPQLPSEDAVTAGSASERAALLSHALTQRKYSHVIAARGGYGTTAFIDALENMLPPVLPEKTLLGFSDVSFIGNYLAMKYPNLTYVHSANGFDDAHFNSFEDEKSLFFKILKREDSTSSISSHCFKASKQAPKSIEALCMPFNLTMLADCFASLRNIDIPEHILFIEDVSEQLYKVLRKIDNLNLSGFIEKTKAIVLGDFTDCKDSDGNQANPAMLVDLIHRKTGLPVLHAPIFGHDKRRFPLVSLSKTKIEFTKDDAQIFLSTKRIQDGRVACHIAHRKSLPTVKTHPHVHFTGIGGTGMAAVAGLFKKANFKVTGSDNPIYPPMDKVISDLGITPYVGYSAGTIQKESPDFVVLANALSRGNPELEYLLASNRTLFSFPSALNRFFLQNSHNIIVAGTHGKTTTTSVIAHLLDKTGHDPSFFVGGVPKNFGEGFRLNSKKVFILEGDEYDTAFFDKGPKFLQYEPSIALINNIEFDHADIYPNVEAIEREFVRLSKLTKERGGYVVPNIADPRVLKVFKDSGAMGVCFTDKKVSLAHPQWIMKSFSAEASGIVVDIEDPYGVTHKVTSQVFGRHNAMNIAGALASAHALALLNGNKKIAEEIPQWCQALSSFSGVKRRFELVGCHNDIAVFDDFAHHPTAITTTLDGFKSYMKAAGRGGRLIACFEPKNATMRRRVLSESLAKSFEPADLVFIGKVAHDARLSADEVLDGEGVAKACGSKARYFSENENLCRHLAEISRPQDTVVFMSSGAFDGMPAKLNEILSKTV